MATPENKDTVTVSFKDTLNLPQTPFPIRSNQADDLALIKRWEEEKLYTATWHHNKGNEAFVFHDGPPYANGPIHTGSAYNKILKDIMTKAQRMMGKHVPITPGWDCHGLPIEIKVSQEHPHADKTALKKACRAYAAGWIDVQRTQFKQLGILMDWDNPYTTMSPSYQAAIIRAFGTFIDRNLIERSNKTVPWCSTCKTVLASAEIEYQERKDPSVYVLFPLAPASAEQLLPSACSNKKVYFLVWTTTPWTLPLNKAVLLKPNITYVVLDIHGTYVIVGEPLADTICALKGVEKNIIASCTSNRLASAGSYAQHPFVETEQVPVLLDDSVLINEGTACVHIAPGAGPIDYEVGIQHNLAIYSPVTPDGRYTQDIQPTELIEMSVIDGNWWALRKLQEKGRLFHKATITHSYPHCWRCHQGLIFRATKQWFFDLEKHGIKEKATQATYHIAAYPEKSINRLRAMVQGRLEWCISRQRVWGVPIPAVLCTQCDTAYYTAALAEQVATHVAIHGIEWWDTATISTIMPHGFVCNMCKSTTCTKEEDILDVWFDSGVSHYAVLMANPELGVPADLYLEGSDQHRGWFQSSLLTAIALYDAAPMRSLYTHGFVVDAKGHKMSKSVGNVIAPEELVQRIGIDGLRMWAASVDNSGEAVLSDVVLNNVQEVFRKVRNTLRFLLSNLYDFDPYVDAVPVEQMHVIDQQALQELATLNTTVIEHYRLYNTTAIFHALSEYCATSLSALYLDIIKDRLYVEQADGILRRSAQTACYIILDALTRLVTPILSCTAEHVSDLYQKDKKQSIHLQSFAKIALYDTGMTTSMWHVLYALRDIVLKAIEERRAIGTIKHSLEARVTLGFDPQHSEYETLQQAVDLIAKTGQPFDQFLREFVIVSQVEYVKQEAGSKLQHCSLIKGIYINIEHAHGAKCPRCWQWDERPQQHDLCRRCFALVGNHT
jgi:isoleucyl-tRNA synthetase